MFQHQVIWPFCKWAQIPCLLFGIWEGEIKGRQNPFNILIIHIPTDTPWKASSAASPSKLPWLSLPLPIETQTSSPGRKGHFNLLADVLWVCTMAANSVKHAECVEPEEGHDIRCLYSFRWERICQGEAHLLLGAPFPANTQDKDRNHTTNNQAAETVPSGEDPQGWASLLMVTSLESFTRSKWRRQEIVSKPAFKKEKLQRCCGGTGAPENFLLSQLNSWPSGL